jgi:hypothetical protein
MSLTKHWVGNMTTETRADSIPAGHNSIRVEVVTTFEQLLHCQAIRAICFMEEHGVKAMQTFDGNDYQATHIIVYADGEPIGTVRVRWFKDFAKFERASFRKTWRHPAIIKRAAFFVFEHCARKGFDRVVTHAKPVYARLWRGLLGFRPVQGKEPLMFAGHDEPYLELERRLDIPGNVIDSTAPASVLFRIEGHWDHASEFETAV